MLVVYIMHQLQLPLPVQVNRKLIVKTMSRRRKILATVAGLVALAFGLKISENAYAKQPAMV